MSCPRNPLRSKPCTQAAGQSATVKPGASFPRLLLTSQADRVMVSLLAVAGMKGHNTHCATGMLDSAVQ